MRVCVSCGASLTGRADQRFCSARCRVRAHRTRRRAVTPDWRVAAALLEAGWPETWGERRRPEPLDASLDDVFAEIDDSISALTSPTR